MSETKEWLIRKDGYFYRPNRAGYTVTKSEAGRYTKTEAEREARIEPWHMKAIHEDEWPDEDGKTAAERFADWLNQGPKLAKAAGLYVGIKVTPAPLPTEGE